MRLLLFLCVLLVPLIARAQEVTVFAAASLTDAMKDISAQWVKAGHQPLRMSFAASSILARQIEQGAPANLFASADEKWMDYLADKNLIAAATRKDLLGNDLVLVVPADKPLHVTIGPDFNLLGLLGANGRLAVGDPAHVPVGIYAEQALKKLGVWDSISPRLARTDDVRSGLLLVERGEAPAGIVYGTDAAISKNVMVAGSFPASSHDPISYPFALTRSGNTADARALLVFLASPSARAIFLRRGFKVE
ncbi:molybdate ABC transporter substrate-binding protein [Rhodopila sp.]|uniref:molybdate ABC transporter substrate-binding protein n=1 Tax=Rhodopila sp. TaxID=2480087 RepID=UPI003D0C2FBA